MSDDDTPIRLPEKVLEEYHRSWSKIREYLDKFPSAVVPAPAALLTTRPAASFASAFTEYERTHDDLVDAMRFGFESHRIPLVCDPSENTPEAFVRRMKRLRGRGAFPRILWGLDKP